MPVSKTFSQVNNPSHLAIRVHLTKSPDKKPYNIQMISIPSSPPLTRKLHIGKDCCNFGDTSFLPNVLWIV